jgi:hypothetical protein
MSKISLLCPTRKRLWGITQLVKSLSITSKNRDNYELLVACDTDDVESINTLDSLIKEFPSINMRVFHREKSDFLNRDYYNFLAEKAEGDFLWVIADDIRFNTNNWDNKLYYHLESITYSLKDRIACFSVSEEGSQAKHPCFPIVTKEAFKVLGMILHPQLLSWGADRTIGEIYEAINRKYTISDVSITHLSYHNKTADFDSTAASMKERFFRNPNCHNEVSEKIVPQQIELLRKYINERMG